MRVDIAHSNKLFRLDQRNNRSKKSIVLILKTEKDMQNNVFIVQRLTGSSHLIG
jgi:hypothetical protein